MTTTHRVAARSKSVRNARLVCMAGQQGSKGKEKVVAVLYKVSKEICMFHVSHHCA